MPCHVYFWANLSNRGFSQEFKSEVKTVYDNVVYLCSKGVCLSGRFSYCHRNTSNLLSFISHLLLSLFWFLLKQ